MATWSALVKGHLHAPHPTLERTSRGAVSIARDTNGVGWSEVRIPRRQVFNYVAEAPRMLPRRTSPGRRSPSGLGNSSRTLTVLARSSTGSGRMPSPRTPDGEGIQAERGEHALLRVTQSSPVHVGRIGAGQFDDFVRGGAELQPCLPRRRASWYLTPEMETR